MKSRTEQISLILIRQLLINHRHKSVLPFIFQRFVVGYGRKKLKFSPRRAISNSPTAFRDQ